MPSSFSDLQLAQSLQNIELRYFSEILQCHVSIYPKLYNARDPKNHLSGLRVYRDLARALPDPRPTANLEIRRTLRSKRGVMSLF
jgi:hypothetical protein